MPYTPPASAAPSAPATGPDSAAAAAQRAALLAANPQAKGIFDPTLPHYEADLEINDFPQHARWKVSHCFGQHRGSGLYIKAVVLL